VTLTLWFFSFHRNRKENGFSSLKIGTDIEEATTRKATNIAATLHDPKSSKTITITVTKAPSIILPPRL
jgi:hypothetical protein